MIEADDLFANESDDRSIGELLQRCFEHGVSDVEVERLLQLWDARPDFDDFARKNLQTEYLLRFLGDQHLRPLRFRFSSEKQIELPKPNGSFGPDRSFDVNTLESLNLDELVRLAATSPPLDFKKFDKKSGPPPSVRPFRERKSSPGKGRALFRILAVFSLGLLFVAALYYSTSPRNTGSKPTENALARITSVANPVFPENAPILLPNQRIGEEPIRLLSGVLELRTPDGVRLVLEGPATFNLQSAASTFCREGRLSVEVPKGAEGFEVRTPLMNVRDLGTAFVVDVRDMESAVHVVKGSVEIDRLVGDWKPVREGVGMIARKGGDVEQTPSDKTLYVGTDRMGDLARNDERRLLELDDERRARWSNDPDLLLYLDFSENSGDEKGVVERIGCRTVAGRRTNENALAFVRADDRLQLSAPASRSSFTVMASVKLNAFSKASDVIFSVGNSDRGALHWQLNRQGQMQILLGERENEGLMNYASPRFLTDHHTDVWLRLALVLNAERKTITHYFEGKPVATLLWQQPGTFDFSRAELGNWRHEDNTPSERFFNGQIEEFILLGRAASPEEIQ